MLSISMLNSTRCFSVSLAIRRTHYETLGVTPSATAAEIKSAYYKLSLRYHPDRQEGNREEFEKINNAYKILGDISSRTLYDRGAFDDSTPPPTSRNYHARTGASVKRPDVPSGRSPIYDFDMWSRYHYGQAMQRRNEAKARYEEKVDERSQENAVRKKENVTVSVFAAIILSGLAAYHFTIDDFDKPPKK